MSDVKQWDFDKSGNREESGYGDYVLTEDYEALVEKYSDLLRKYVKLQDAVTKAYLTF